MIEFALTTNDEIEGAMLSDPNNKLDKKYP